MCVCEVPPVLLTDRTAPPGLFIGAMGSDLRSVGERVCCTSSGSVGVEEREKRFSGSLNICGMVLSGAADTP